MMRTSSQCRERSNSLASNCSSGSTGGGSSSGGLSNPIIRSYDVCDIVKAGYVHIKRPPSNGTVKIRLKTWQKRYFVLHDQYYDNGTVRLEIYSTESQWQEHKPDTSDCFTVDLQTVTHVDEYTESKSYPYAFTITRSGQGPLVVGTDTEYDFKEWIVAIRILTEKLKPNHVAANESHVVIQEKTRRPSCPPRLTHWNSAHQLHTNDDVNNNASAHGRLSIDSGAHGRPSIDSGDPSGLLLLKLPPSIPACSDCLVKVIETDAAVSNCLIGEYHMVILGDVIHLRRPNSKHDVISWQIFHIRKFKSEDQSDGANIVTLEANAHCGPSSGLYLFRTVHGRKLIQRVKMALSEPTPLHRDPDKDLERLRVRQLPKAPSTPNLFNRSSPPRPVPRCPPDVATRERKPSSSETPPKPNAYLDLLPEEHIPAPSDEYIEELHRIDERATNGATDAPHGPRLYCRRPPVPPPSLERPSPPRSVHGDSPPVLPPRRTSCSPPPPPPRPRHTLGTNSGPV